MTPDHWIAVGIILSTLLAPLLANLVRVRLSRVPPKRATPPQGAPGVPRGPTDRDDLACLPFLVALSLDIYVIVFYPQSGSSGHPVTLVHALAPCGFKVSTMLALIVVHGQREVTRTTIRALRDQKKAFKEMIDAGLQPTLTKLAKLSDEQMAIQRKLVGRDKGLVANLTKVRDEVAASDAELLDEIRASNPTSKGLQPQSQESLPERKMSTQLNADLMPPAELADP